MPDTARGDFPYPSGGDAADVPADIQALAEQNGLVAALYGQGVASGRPSAIADRVGMFWYSTDTGFISYCTGSSWVTINLGMPAGTIVDFGGATEPSGWVFCYGQALSRTTFAALFAAVGTNWDTFGGLSAPAGTDFRVPDLRALGTVGKGNMGGSSSSRTVRIARAGITTLANLFGEENHALVAAENAPHTHTQEMRDGGTVGAQDLTDRPARMFGGSINSNQFPGIVSQGSGTAHENVHPVAVVNKLIKT